MAARQVLVHVHEWLQHVYHAKILWPRCCRTQSQASATATSWCWTPRSGSGATWRCALLRCDHIQCRSAEPSAPLTVHACMQVESGKPPARHSHCTGLSKDNCLVREAAVGTVAACSASNVQVHWGLLADLGCVRMHAAAGVRRRGHAGHAGRPVAVQYGQPHLDCARSRGAAALPARDAQRQHGL